MSDVDVAGGSPTRIEVELVAPLIFIENPVHVPMRIEDAAGQERVNVSRNGPDSVEQLRPNSLRAEPFDELVVVDLPLDLPGGDHEILDHLRVKRGAL